MALAADLDESDGGSGMRRGTVKQVQGTRGKVVVRD